MSERILPEELVAIYKRAKLATKGEWEVYEESDGTHIGTSWDHPQLKSPLPIVSLSVSVKEPHHRIHIDKEDAEFIAHAREDIPMLLDEVDRLRKNEVEYRRMLIHLRDKVLGCRSVYEKDIYQLLYGSKLK